MLFDEPMATQGFRTTGNDPLNQFASWYQFGQNLRQGADARRARKEAQEMAKAEAQKYGNSNPQQGAIGVDASGVYGVNSTPAQPPVGIGADASGMYGVNGTPQQSKYTFNESDYIPSEGNGYHLGDYKQTEMYGNPTDFQRQMASNAIGYNLGSFEPRQQTWFPKDGNGTNPDNSMNITSQKIGQNYNGRIDGQVGGLNIPQSPQQNGFGSAINNAENPLNSFTGGSVSNFLNPVASGDSAQVAGGATNLSADNPFARSSKYLGADYDKMAYVKSALDNGVKNPLVAMAMYDQMIAPLREAAKEDELRNAFFVLQNPNSSEQDKMNAVSLIQYYKKDPYMEENQQIRRQNAMADRSYKYSRANGMMSSGSGFVDRVRDLKGRIGYRAPDGTNCMRTLGIALSGTPYEGLINVDNAVETARKRGDLHISGDGYVPQAGDIAVVNDGNHAVMLTENGGTIQNGESANGIYESDKSPEEMFGGVKYWISSSRYAGGGNSRSYGNRSNRNYSDRQYAAEQKAIAKQQELFDKNFTSARKAALNLAGLQNISSDDENGIKKYDEGMEKFSNSIEGIYDGYGLNRIKDKSSEEIAIALYHKLNETRSGLRPETLAEGVARAVYAKRGDVGAEQLQSAILDEVYNQGNDRDSTGRSIRRYSDEHNTNLSNDKALAEMDARRMDGDIGDLTDNSDGKYVTTDAYGNTRKETENQYKTRRFLVGDVGETFNPRYEKGTNWWNGVFRI